jgi:hypothetical protein
MPNGLADWKLGKPKCVQSDSICAFHKIQQHSLQPQYKAKAEGKDEPGFTALLGSMRRARKEHDPATSLTSPLSI